MALGAIPKRSAHESILNMKVLSAILLLVLCACVLSIRRREMRTSLLSPFSVFAAIFLLFYALDYGFTATMYDGTIVLSDYTFPIKEETVTHAGLIYAAVFLSACLGFRRVRTNTDPVQFRIYAQSVGSTRQLRVAFSLNAW